MVYPASNRYPLVETLAGYRFVLVSYLCSRWEPLLLPTTANLVSIRLCFGISLVFWSLLRILHGTWMIFFFNSCVCLCFGKFSSLALLCHAIRIWVRVRAISLARLSHSLSALTNGSPLSPVGSAIKAVRSQRAPFIWVSRFEVLCLPTWSFGSGENYSHRIELNLGKISPSPSYTVQFRFPVQL